MISYNSKTLDNVEVIDAAETALDKQCISIEEFREIKKAYPVDLYTPNPYVRIGLFILTLIASSFALGLFMLASISGGEQTVGVMLLIAGGGFYGMIEYMVHTKKHHKSGVDTALMWMSGGCVITGVFIITDTHIAPSAFSLILCMLATFYVLRFADVVMTIIAFLAFLALLFFVFMSAGKVIIPFMIMGVSLATYLVAAKLEKIHTYRHYISCLKILQITALITLYVGGNYYVVREVSNEMFDMDLQPGQSIPGGWIFWIFTVILPPLYIFIGVRKKNMLLIRTGLFLVAGMIYTVRTYHSVAPIEVAMTFGGIILIAGVYGLTKLLTPSRNGFTAEKTDDDEQDALQLESLVIAQTFSHPGGPQPDTFDFGGGSASGGGASGGY
jgi:uncharacterized membrane protein YgcG